MATAIKQYISTKYDQHPDMFTRDLEAIDKLRVDAVNVLEAHVSGIKKLTAYAAQLVFIGGKFPIDIGVEFAWYPALGFNTQRPISEDNLRFELANILYNLAALYSQLAISLNRSTSEGLKSACNYFCLAAGILGHIKLEVIPEMRTLPPDDMDTMTLESLQQLMLAQAQECFWSKAVKDNMKDGLIAKLAAKVSDLYDQAAEFGTKSDCISTEWIHHMTAKHHHFAAAAQYRASRECLEKQKYGEEVARLRDSLTCVNEALKESRWINKIVQGDLNGLRSRVSEDLKRAEKDNDVIYLMTVPPKSELKTLDRAGMAIARVPQEVSEPTSTLGDHGVFGQPLFTKLVPYAVHIAASIYEERKNRLVNSSIIDELEKSTNKLRELLQSLNLPGSLQALEKPLGLPPTLVAHAEEIRQQEGLHRLRRTMHETSKLKGSDEAVYKEGSDILQSEATEDDRARLKYGTERWTRPRSKQAAESLYKQSTEIDGYLKSARSSDELVRSKLKDHESILQVLSGTDRDLEEYVPSSRRAQMPPNVQKAATALRAVLGDVSRLESRRTRKAESLREKAKQDDINTVILAEAARLERDYPMQKIEPAQFENLFEARLERYDSDRQMLLDESNAQAELSSQIQEANRDFLLARKGDTSTKEREQALQRLENAYFKYKEIISNLNTGRKFYNDLAKIVGPFRDDCKSFAYQRRVEAGQWEADLSSGIGALSLQHTKQLQEQKQREAVPYGTKAPAEEPLTAPTPTRAPPPPQQLQPGMWNPEMGIKFGGTGAIGVNGSARQEGVKGGQWDAGKGLKFS